mgnify:CR=1
MDAEFNMYVDDSLEASACGPRADWGDPSPVDTPPPGSPRPAPFGSGAAN